MHIYEVGKPYHPQRSAWPEAVQYNYRSGSHELVLFLNGVKPAEIQDVTRGECEFGLFVSQPTIFFLYRFGKSIPWSDAPYSWHLLPREERTLPPTVFPLGAGALLDIFLVEASDGILQGMRAVGLSSEFTVLLNDAIREQAGAPWCGPGPYDRALQEAYRQYPSSVKMLERAQARVGFERQPVGPV